MSHFPQLLVASIRVYRALLYLYPAEFRREFGAPMQQLFHDQLHAVGCQRGGWGVARVWLRTLADLAATVPAEHLTTLQQTFRGWGGSALHYFNAAFGQQGAGMLHITNGESAARTIRKTGLPGRVLAWNDVLHEGPAPAGLSLDQLRELRARFIAGQGWASYEAVIGEFLRRDRTLEQFATQAEVVLWFEHDLYDQLQLIQLLDWFAQRDLGETTLSLICIGTFPGLPNFHGLGELNPAQLHSLFPTRTAVRSTQLALGRAAWQAFCSPDPTAIEALLHEDTSALPFLHAALTRHLEQFPAVGSGLSRTEQQIIHAVAEGKHTPAAIFQAQQREEAAPFMGDSTLWSYIATLCDGHDPVLRRVDGHAFVLPAAFDNVDAFLNQALELTDQGQAVLAGRAERTQHGMDRWLGGVHLGGTEPRWRWDAGASALRVAPARPG